MLEIIYKRLWYLVTPLGWAWICWRSKKGKEQPSRRSERFGRPSHSRPKGPLIWCHGISVGEVVSLDPLITYLKEHYPQVTILITTGTVTAASIIEKKYGNQILHQYIPLDHPRWVKNFYSYWNPTVGIIIESEFWPNLILSASCPLWLLSGRFTERSFKRWEFISVAFMKRILQKFEWIVAQTPADRQRFKTFYRPEIQLFNLKFAAKPLEVNDKALKDLKQLIAGRPFWIAASTHPGEEEIIAEAHIKIKAQILNILTILIPRHPARAGDIRTLLVNRNLKVCQRSNSKTLDPGIDIYMADTLGEMGTFYALNSIVFLGGSLLPHIGGHNLLEPAHFKNAILSGPFMHKSLDIQHVFLENGGCKTVGNADDLTAYCIDWLTNPEKLHKQQKLTASVILSLKDQQVDFWKQFEQKMRSILHD